MVDVDPAFRTLVRMTSSITLTPRTVPVFRLGGRLSGLVTRPVDGVDVRDEAGDDARVRVYQPAVGGTTAALLWVHGGGLVIGTAEQDDARASRIARDLGVTVVSARYRLAPAHPFPAAVDDVHAAWHWLQSNAERLGLDRTRVVIGGESAGGGLAASLAQRLRDEGGQQPVGQLLVYPMLDDRTAADRSLDREHHPVWNNRSNLTGWSAYLGYEPGSGTTPDYAVPARRDDLTGLPPAWIGVGTADLFLDECRLYACRLAAASVRAEIVEVPGGPHGLDVTQKAAPSQRFRAAQLAWLTETLRL
jgi:acetyl esterase/lipase